MKLCVDCNNNPRDRQYARCVGCRRRYSREHYHKHKDVHRLKFRKWYASRPDYKDIVRNRRHSDTSRMEKYKLARKQHYWDNREVCLERAKKYRKDNPDKILASTRKRRALLTKSQGTFTNIEWIELCNMFGNKCLHCSYSGKLEADHIIPLTLGGNNYITNIQPLCKRCNIGKSNRVVVDYRLKSKLVNNNSILKIYG